MYNLRGMGAPMVLRARWNVKVVVLSLKTLKFSMLAWFVRAKRQTKRPCPADVMPRAAMMAGYGKRWV